MRHKQARRLAEITPKIMSVFHGLGRQHPTSERLSMRQFQTLLLLDANGSMTLSDLCEKLAVASSTGTELANRLVEAGLIDKAEGSGDKRQHLLSVSPAGAALLKKRRDDLVERFAELLDHFNPKDREAFVKSFETIWKIASKYRRERH